MSTNCGISLEEFERYAMHDNCVGIVDADPRQADRIAEILSERHRGIIFLWDISPGDRKVTICAVRPDRHRMRGSDEEKMVLAGEAIARNVATKHRISLLSRLFGRRPRPGWHYIEQQ